MTGDKYGCTSTKLLNKLEQFRLKGDTKCGTVACAVGWLPAAFPREFKWINKSEWEYINIKSKNSNLYNEECAKDYFGLDKYECGYLFMPQNYNKKNRNKRYVIQRIRQFVKTNDINDKVLPHHRNDLITWGN